MDAASPLSDLWPADRPLLGVINAPLDTEGVDGDAVVALVSRLAPGRELLVGVAAPLGAGRDDALVAQLLTCDRVREEIGLPTVLLDGVPDPDVAATAVLAGRADLVLGPPSLVSETWRPRRAAADAAVAVARA